MSPQQRTVRIRQFIADEVGRNPRSIAGLVAGEFGITRQAVSRHLREMESAGVLASEGQTNAKTWRLLPKAELRTEIALGPGVAEDAVWRRHLKDAVADVPDNVAQIVAHAFTEMFNNAIDHSESDDATVELLVTAESVRIVVADRGVGIFRKIADAFGLDDEREAILQLSVGKLTTDPARHTGEGIFFTSRMCDVFEIRSRGLIFTHHRPENDWLIETEADDAPGTRVAFAVSLRSDLTIGEVFSRYASADDYAFSQTHVPVRLAKYDGDQLLSRSQARRVLARFDRFKEVMLDFEGIDFVGQAFADEIFRVYANNHPDKELVAVNAGPAVRRMIDRALSVVRYDPRQKSLFDEAE